MGVQKKQRKLKPDAVLKNYWSNNEQFADLFNAVLFGGASVIQPEELEDIGTEQVSVLEHRDFVESIQASRDNLKIQKRSVAHGIQMVLLGLENQEHIHYAMPMRVMGYDYGAYKKQYDSNAGKYRASEGMDEDEYLSRMKKTDKFIPVITIVVYYGEKVWDGARSLHEMLCIPQEWKEYVNDYKLLLVEARKSGLPLHNANNIDLFQLLQIILDKSLPRKEVRDRAIAYGREHRIEKEVLMAVAGATNSSLDEQAWERRGGDMCTLFEEIAEEGKIEGEAKGIIETSREFHISDSEILLRLQSKLNLPLQEAQKYMQMYGKQQVSETCHSNANMLY